MQVRKFEAKSMKDALVLVKAELGPDAILLSAKSVARNSALNSGNRVEVTAAVSEQTLSRKKIAEAKLNVHAQGRFKDFSAKQQREFIDKVFNKKNDQEVKPKVTGTRYIDIDDDQLAPVHNYKADLASVASHAASRIKNAALDAFEASSDLIPVKKPVEPVPQIQVGKPEFAKDNLEVDKLRHEIDQLRQVISGFQNVPQNFVGTHPGANKGLAYKLSAAYQNLKRAGISAENSARLLNDAQQVLSDEQLEKNLVVWAWVAKRMLDETVVVETPYADRYHVFVGPSGSGKTSMLLRMASQLVINSKKTVAIVTTDNEKLGATEQLKIFGRILNVPVVQVDSRAHWDLVEEKLNHIDCILVDMPGSALGTSTELNQLMDKLPSTNGGRSIHYVQSCLAKDVDAIEISNRYKKLGFTDVMFTKLDESIQHGIIYNFQRQHQVPIHSFGVGRQIPEDFERATKERVIDLILKISNSKRERGAE